MKANESADYGTLIHHWKETGETDPEWASERDISLLERKLLLSGTDRRKLWPGGEHEVTFAIELRTLVLEIYTGERTKAACEAWKKTFNPADYLTGTIDYLAGRWVDDLKTGHWLDKPSRSGQLKSYSLVNWLLERRPRGYVGFGSYTQWEKYPLGKPPKRVGCKYTVATLELHVDDLRWARENPSEVVVSDHCTFCPCRVMDGPWEWLSPWKYNISCPSGLAQLQSIANRF